MRYTPHTDSEREAMLARIGVDRVEDLFVDIPERFRFPELDVPEGLGMLALERRMSELAEQNLNAQDLVCLLGAGAYNHYVPPVVDSILRRGEFLTAYTPYQPEISQGTLTAVFEFQSMIATLTGMSVANASLYDGATAAAEGALMAARSTRRDSIVVARSVHPHYRAVIETYVQGLAMPVREVGFLQNGTLDLDAARQLVDEDTACLVVGYPNFFGSMEDLAAAAEIAHSVGALLVVTVNPTALALFEPPGTFGADIVVGEGQPLGLPLMFGGPYLGLMATREGLTRQMPGRVVGQTVDLEGRRAYVMTLRAREQDIRRERATSNICTNQNLVALAATVYMGALGETGLKNVAAQCYHKAHYARDRLLEIPGVESVLEGPFFHEFPVRFSRPVQDMADELLAEGILGPYDLGRAYPELEGCALFCFTEMVPREAIDLTVETVGAL